MCFFLQFPHLEPYNTACGVWLSLPDKTRHLITLLMDYDHVEITWKMCLQKQPANRLQMLLFHSESHSLLRPADRSTRLTLL